VPAVTPVQKQQGCAVAIMVFLFLFALVSLLEGVGVFGKGNTFGRVAGIIFFFILCGAGFLLLKAPAIGRNWILRQVYGVTDKRVIVISGGGRVMSLDPSMLTTMKADVKPDGSGDLLFGTIGSAERQLILGIFAQRNVAGVEALIRKTLLPPA